MKNESLNRIGTIVLLLIFLTFAIAILANIPNRMDVMAKQQVPEGDPTRGATLIYQYGCGTCHEVPGIEDAHGRVGPKLANLSRRTILAGQLPNNPDNLMLWIEHPQKVRPGNDMPELGVSESDARDIAAYLYSLR